MDVDVARVTRREPGMNAVEVMTSESQERMLAIVRPDDLDEVLALCARWEIQATVVGTVNDTGRFRVLRRHLRRARRPRSRTPALRPARSRRGASRPTTRRSPTCRSAASATGRATTGRSAGPTPRTPCSPTTRRP